MVNQKLNKFSFFCFLLLSAAVLINADKNDSRESHEDDSRESHEDGSSSNEHGSGGQPHNPTTTAPPRSTTNKNTAAPPAGAPSTTAKQVNPAATTTAFPLNEFCQNKPNGNYANPTTCLNFIMCSNGYGYLFDCPGDLVYNPTNGVCDYPSNVPSCK